MGDVQLLWFECKNPNCVAIHNKGIANPKLRRTMPVCFLSYVHGEMEHVFTDSKQLLEMSFNCEYGRIIIYDSTSDKQVNSLFYPIVGERYCKLCFDLCVKNMSLDEHTKLNIGS